ncbi:unnamed protein product, partial [Polarella glacialis]
MRESFSRLRAPTSERSTEVALRRCRGLPPSKAGMPGGFPGRGKHGRAEPHLNAEQGRQQRQRELRQQKRQRATLRRTEAGGVLDLPSPTRPADTSPDKAAAFRCITRPDTPLGEVVAAVASLLGPGLPGLSGMRELTALLSALAGP